MSDADDAAETLRIMGELARQKKELRRMLWRFGWSVAFGLAGLWSLWNHIHDHNTETAIMGLLCLVLADLQDLKGKAAL